MNYFYIPSTYQGFIGRGFRGGGFDGAYGYNCGYLVGGGKIAKLEFKEAPLFPPPPVPPAQAPYVEQANIYEKLPNDMSIIDKQKIAGAEANGKPLPITEEEFNLWRYLGRQAKRGYQFTKRKIGKYGRKVGRYIKKRTAPYVEKAKIYGLATYYVGKDLVKEKYGKTKAWMKEKLNALINKTVEKIRATRKWLGEKLSGPWKKTKEIVKATTKICIDLIKEVGVNGLTLVAGTMEVLGSFLKGMGWSPAEIAIAYALLKNPPTVWERIANKSIDTLPSLTKAIGKAIAYANPYTAAASAVSDATGAIAGVTKAGKIINAIKGNGYFNRVRLQKIVKGEYFPWVQRRMLKQALKYI